MGDMAVTMRIAADNSHALVTTVDPVPVDDDRLHRPMAPFLTQLLATRNGLPQTRLRRRADASDAAAVYEAQAPVHAKSYQHRLWRQL
jgi:hypothetical protein